MNAAVLQYNLVTDLESRQDDVLLRLDELNKRVERVLQEFQLRRNTLASSSDAGAKSIS
jgi:hypothetical protein